MEIVRPTVQEWCIPVQYTSSPEIIKNCLQEVLNEGMINPQASTPDNEAMRKSQKEKIIKAHMEQYTTKYYDSDNRWHSFLPDENHPRKMRPIAKRKFEDLEKAILAYYEEQEQLNNRRKITLRKFYPEWFQYKWQETNNSNYMKHIDGEWKRYYLDDEIIDQPIIDLTTLDLKNWARNKIVSNHMTKKQYYNMAIIIRQSFDYFVELGDLPVNHFAEFKINASLFTPPKSKEAAERVFIEDEEKKLKQIALQDFEGHPEHIGAAAVLINLSLRLRVSELVALQWKDLKDGYLQIRRMEQKQWEQLPDGIWKAYLTVVDHTKSTAGTRTLYVVSSSAALFEQVRAFNLRMGYDCEPDSYIFLHDNNRITANSIDSYYERYCKMLGIAKKGNHGARRTALTKIADNPNINLKDAMQWAGHRDVKTFIDHYCYSRYSDEQKKAELEKTLNL